MTHQTSTIQSFQNRTRIQAVDVDADADAAHAVYLAL
jgi:hypothetical protein